MMIKVRHVHMIKNDKSGNPTPETAAENAAMHGSDFIYIVT